MAILKTDIASGQASVNAKDRVDGQRVTGEVHFAEAVYTTTGAELNGDTLDVVQLPVGAVLMPELSRVTSEGVGGTSVAISKIGDAADDDRYSATSIAVSAAGTVAVTPVVATSLVVRTPVTGATNTIKATVSLSAAPTAGKKVVFLVAFRMP